MSEPEGRSEPAIRFELELTEDDVLAAHFWTLFQHPVVRVLVGLNVLLLLLALLGLVRLLAGRGAPGWPLFVELGLLAAFAAAVLRVRLRASAHFRALDASARRGHYAFHDDRFEWTLGAAPGYASRDAVARVGETGRHLFLMTRSGATHALPTRCLEPDQADAILRWSHGSSDVETG